MVIKRSNTKKILHLLEFILLFFGIPLLIYFDRDFIHPSIIVFPALVFIVLLLKYTTNFRFRELFRWGIAKAVWVKNGLIMLVCLLLMLGYVFWFERENLFNLPRTRPLIYVLLCIFYPVFSAFGQEVIYRTFLYRRYMLLFPRVWQFILASGITFSFLHIVYYHPVSIIMTFFGGIYFAKVYLETRSVLFTSVLHGLMGIMVFGVGLGQYFWLDIPV
jgi:membrane protease YdiL (CAAX protease family)